MISRRQFNIGLTALAFSGLHNSALGKMAFEKGMKVSKGYGPLIEDPNKLLDLPRGFSYEIISQLGQKMSDGLEVPDRADGMGCLPLDDERVVLVRNHEIHPAHIKKQPESIQQHKTPLAYDTIFEGIALPGGTCSIIYNLKTQKVEKEFISLTGTIRNCSGGITPWGSWLTCEESVDTPNEYIDKEHGYVFEVPASADSLIEARPIKAMGRFNHEAAIVDPKTGIVYQTEDRNDGLLYRFIPKEYGQLHLGGKLQALVVKGKPGFDTRNWDDVTLSVGDWLDTLWIDIEDPESPNDSLRKQGFEKGAAIFARGEGIHWSDETLSSANAGEGSENNGAMYLCCSSGGDKKLGQIFCYAPSEHEGTEKESSAPGKLQLFLESTHESLYNFGDNLTVTPKNHLLICEDQYSDVVNNHLRGVTPDGAVYTFAKLRIQTEPAGACFSPDGSTLFVNAYSPATTLAIRGPWEKFVA